MKVYWDSSALVAATMDMGVRRRLREPGQVGRSHALAEVFSTLTGSRLGFRLDPADAARVVGELSEVLEFIELDAAETVQALHAANERGVRGGRVHDYLHAVAAIKGGCGLLRTLNARDFEGLFPEEGIAGP